MTMAHLSDSGDLKIEIPGVSSISASSLSAYEGVVYSFLFSWFDSNTGHSQQHSKQLKNT